MRKIFTYMLTIATVALLGTSCKSYLDVNNNLDFPDTQEDYSYLPGIEEQWQGLYWDVRGVAPLAQMMGTTSSTYSAFAVNAPGYTGDQCAEIFRLTYWNQGKNLENMINQAVAAEHWHLAGIGYAIKAYSWDQLTKLCGELPMKQAFEEGRLSFDYDYQDSIMLQVREWAYKAVEYLQMADASSQSSIANKDYIYGGNIEKWTKFAYGIIVRDLGAMSHKTNFVSGGFADELISCAEKSLATAADDAELYVPGGQDNATYDSYNNYWGVYRENLYTTYYQHDYAVQVMTGTVPEYGSNGDLVDLGDPKLFYKYALSSTQIVADTIRTVAGHFDPRVVLKLGYNGDLDNSTNGSRSDVINRVYVGGSFTSRTGYLGYTAPSFYGTQSYPTADNAGEGRWIYKDNAPYIIMTAADIKFLEAEAYWMKGDKTNALNCFKAAVSLDVDFTAAHIAPGASGAAGGDKITVALYNTLAAEYLQGPYVGGMTASTLTLSHIMMQRWVSLYPWGALEAWTDMRKAMYDISYTGDYPKTDNGWTVTTLNQKVDTDATKIYKGFYLAPAQVQGRRGSYAVDNGGSPCFRIRPRYNSEYMWNLSSLQALKPIAGDAVNYHCSIPWFAYPGDMPETL